MDNLVVNGISYEISNFNDSLSEQILFTLINHLSDETGEIFKNVHEFYINDKKYKNIDRVFVIGVVDEKSSQCLAKVKTEQTAIIDDIQDTLDTLMTQIIPELRGE